MPRGARWVILVAAVLMAFGLTRTAWEDRDARVPGPYGGLDAVMQASLLEWSGRDHPPGEWERLPVFHPAPRALSFMDSLLGQAWLVKPFAAMGLASTPAARYNLALTLTLLGAAAAAALWWRAAGGGWGLGAFVGLAVLASPYTLSQMGHLNQLPPPPLLLAFAAATAALRALGRGAAGRSTAFWILAAFASAWQALWGWYGFAYAVTGVVTGAAVWSWSGRRGLPWRRLLFGVVLYAVLTGGLTAPYASLYFDQRRDEAAYDRSDAEARFHSADIQHVLRRGAYRLALGDVVGDPPDRSPENVMTRRQVLHPGWVVGCLAAWGWWRRRDLPPEARLWGRVALGVGLVGLVLAFGDSVGLPGTDRRLPLPMAALRELEPVRGLRTLWRFSFLAQLAAAWWAASGLRRWTGASGPRRWAPALLCVLVVAESWPVGVSAVTVPQPTVVSLAEASGPVLTLPAPERELDEDLIEAGRLMRAMGHGRPVSGGVSGWVPPSTRRLRLGLAACERGEADPDSVLAAWRSGLGGRWIELATGHRDGRAEFWLGVLRRNGAEPRPAVSTPEVLYVLLPEEGPAP